MIGGMSEEPKRGRGRPRRAETGDEILRTTLEMLRDGGFEALTVDAIAERTGVAKTTIYRRWPGKGALVAAALAPIDDTAEILRMLGNPSGELIEALRALLAPRVAARGGDDEAYREVGAVLARYLLSP